MGYLRDMYKPEVMSPLATDAYHFTTPAAYYNEGRADNEAVFIMFGRKAANGGSYTIAAGLEGVIDIVQTWQQDGLSDDDIDFLRTQKDSAGVRKFSDAFLDYIKKCPFNLKIDAAPEGSLLFPQEPALRIQGPLSQVKMLESVALGIMNGACADATKTTRIVEAASMDLPNGAPKMLVSTQGLRRGPAFGSSVENSRGAAIGGSLATSTGNAAKMLGEKFAGTMDHQWVMAHITQGNNEIGDLSMADLLDLEKQGKTKELHEALRKDAFRSFAFTHRNDGILLLDTIDPLQGLENAIALIKELQDLGYGQRYGVRFDSGDLTEYSKIALRRFAEEGLVEGVDPADVSSMTDADLLPHADHSKVLLAVADGLDEHSIMQMRQDGAAYHLAGVGTGISHPGPLGLVYKMSAMVVDMDQNQVLSHYDIDADAFTPTMKISAHAPEKSSNPGLVNSRRFYDKDGKLQNTVIYDERSGLEKDGRAVNLRDFDDQTSIHGRSSQDLLQPIFNRAGELVYKQPPKRETYPGSGKMVTDLGAISAYRQSQMETLDDDMRRIVKPYDQQIQERLFEAYQDAGDQDIIIDPAKLRANLTPEAKQIPIYLDHNLYSTRMRVQSRHTQTTTSGIGDYTERYRDPQRSTPSKRGRAAMKTRGSNNGPRPS